MAEILKSIDVEIKLHKSFQKKMGLITIINVCLTAINFGVAIFITGLL
jgi:hypothetical protein